ncbi:SusC/RagA family TonB-linked outer membrane protein [Olivibacter sitiensis]|uniref:SusC/RagA family TonB-linked outer membrane protein n=1 Tax=Olivibacter sitiensis TaxID=376470 RepID=UPI00041AC0BA|nr:SusC/RagA family TonB-linked outer membrane protein [Olivibacter sitiensis]
MHTVDGIGWGGPVDGMNDRQNPVRVLEDNKQNGYHYLRLFGNFFADVKILQNLTFRSNVGIDYGSNTSRNWQKKYQSGYLVNDVNRVINRQSNSVKTTWSNTLNYNLVMDKHRLDVLGGTEYYVEDFSEFMASREGYILEDPDYMYLDAGTGLKDNEGFGAKHVLLSYFAKANYSYLDRYLLSATLRYDGSSRFGENNRFGTFPAFSAGWRISEEAFIKNATSLFDDLKLRFGWGMTGNQEINNNAIYNIYLANYDFTSYDINGNKSGVLPSGVFLSQNANPDLRWEATSMSNAGIDFSFLNQKLYGSVDAYLKKTSDILLLPPYIGTLGEGGNKWVNGASMENKGLEIVLGHRGNINEDLKLDITANLDIVRNKVTHLPDEVVNAYGGDGRGQNILGRTLDSYFGYVADGIFRTQQEVDEHANQPGKGMGRIRFVDLNGDGVINDFDRTWIGVPIPKFTYGFNAAVNYKNFDLSFFLQGIGPVDVNNEFKIYTDFWSAIESSSNKGARLLDAWSPSNPNSDIPAASLTDDNWEARLSTYHIENGTYLKLRNAQIGYTFSKELLNKLKMQSLRIYVGGDNLGILYKSGSYTGLDPENPGFGYPNPLVVTAGVNVRF